MTSTERGPELCIDCGREVPGGGYCRECLQRRMREISEALDRPLSDRAGDFRGVRRGS